MLVFVGHRAGASLYRVVGKNNQLNLLDTLSFPQGKFRNQDFLDDRPGSSPSPTGFARSPQRPKHSAVEIERAKIAMEMTQYLKRVLEKNPYTKMIVVLDPKLMGLVRYLLPTNFLNFITAFVTKNLSKVPSQKIWARVKEELPWPNVTYGPAFSSLLS